MKQRSLFMGLSAVLFTLIMTFATLSFVNADSGERTYQYLIGSGFLCDFDPSACPVIAMAENGDTIEVSGEGTLTIHPKSVTGEGTFVHRNADGNIVGSGTWTAMELLSFHSYGSGSEQGLPPEFEGGKALIRVHLVGDNGLEFDGVMQVDCVLGDQIPSGAIEGITLNVQDAINFNQEVSGFTVYVRE